MNLDLRRNPWRLFFPIGLFCLWAGVSHWVWYALGWSFDSSAAFHGIAQTQGFVLSMAYGFALTMLPRRTDATPPSVLLLTVLVLGSGVAVALVRFGRVREGETLFLVGVVAALAFVLKCLRRGRRRAPAAFVWIPIAFTMALVGAVMTGLGVALGERFFGWHALGKLCVTQGMIDALILGAGSLALPVMTGTPPPPDADLDPNAARVRRRAWCLAAGLVAGFALEVFVDYRVGHGLRALVLGYALFVTLGVGGKPGLPGINRLVMRVAPWMIPAGHLCAAVLPWPRLGLHVVFAGGFAPLALAIALHVALAHGGKRALCDRSPASVVLLHALLAVALTLRVVAELDPLRRYQWLGGAGGALLSASLVWGALVLPVCFRAPAPPVATSPAAPRDRS